MPTNDTDKNKNPEVNPESQDDANAGDILEQLKSESATATNLYKLELKMFKTITNMDKTLTKEQKSVHQAKRNLDNIHAVLMSVNKDTGNIYSAVTSVDSSLKRVITVLEKMQDSGTIYGTKSSTGSGTTVSTGSDLALFESKIAAEEKRRKQVQAEYDAGSMDESEYNERMEELQDSIDLLTKKQDEAVKALADMLHAFSGYATFTEKFEASKQNLLEQFETGEITIEELRNSLSDLKVSLDQHTETVSAANKRWDDQGDYSFAGEARRLKAQIEEEYNQQKEELFDRFERGVPDEDGNPLTDDAFNQLLTNLIGEREDALSTISMFGASGADSAIKVGEKLDSLLVEIRAGRMYDARTGKNTLASDVVETIGSIGGTLVGAEVGTAIGTAIGGPVGAVVGGVIGDFLGSKIEALATLIGDKLDYLANHSKKTRDEILQAGMDKIRNDVKDMATYSVEIYEKSANNIYASWDKNLAQLTATQGYTKEALNSLQDAVAQRLQAEGYGTTIDASQFLDQLANTLNANLGGTLAEAFAAQNLILQKAVPEVDLSSAAAQFAAIYASANRQTGAGEDTMIAAMNEIAGAAKALESVTEGNNQFLKETSTLLQKATEVVTIAGGNADQISGLTTQMMASEAAITAVAPQLSGFTSELVSVLMNNNDATAVALRAIMNDLNTDIGVSATSFMKSFMEDTQGTLSTAFAAIQRFIDQNENAASRQEFLHAMESVFGVSGSKLAQIDFGEVADMIAQVNTSVNMAALTNAENLVRSGETTTLEEQLLANTTNQLLATNTIAATLDNKLMRKLESNELAMEKLVYSAQATQSVELAENTLTFFTRISDLLVSIIDPLGIFEMVTTSINAATAEEMDATRYMMTATMSSIGSTVADSAAATANVFANTIGGATAVMDAAQSKSTDRMAEAVEQSGVSKSFETMMADYSSATRDAQVAMANSSAESNVLSYAAMEQQARQSAEYQQKQDAANEQNARYEEEKAAAREQQRIAQEAESVRNLENHDNIVIIRDALDDLDMSSYLEPILNEHRTHTEQIKDLQAQTTEIVKLISTIIEYNMTVSPEFASTISYDEKSRIMDNGYVTSTAGAYF